MCLSKLWSSQLWTQFKQLRMEAWKSQDFNGVWTRDLAIPVRRFNPVEILTFSDFYMQLLKLRWNFITVMITAYLISNPQFNIWNISYITLMCLIKLNLMYLEIQLHPQ